MILYIASHLGIMYNETDAMIEEMIQTSIKLWAAGLDKVAKNLRRPIPSMHPNHSCDVTSRQEWKNGKIMYR